MNAAKIVGSAFARWVDIPSSCVGIKRTGASRPLHDVAPAGDHPMRSILVAK